MGKKVLNEIFLRKNLMIRCFITFMVFSLTIATQTFAQADKKVTINVQNTLVRTVLDQLQRDTHLHFVYEESTINPTQRVSLNYQNAPLSSVLTDFCKQTSLRYEIKRNLILILPPNTTQTDKKHTPIDIAGTVFDENGETLIGVNVYVPSTGSGTITDIDGHFSIKAVPGDLLTFTFVGMADKAVKVTQGMKILKINMESSATALQDVVVTGYQTISSERATGSYSVIPQKNFKDKLETDLLSRMEGLVAGINKMGTKDEIVIRGITTYKGETKPLYVVDGMPYEGDINFINPSDVQNITVLKDAAASSIYGARAANGVIVVTTLNGGNENGKNRVRYNGSVRFSPKPDIDYLNLMNSSEFVDFQIDQFNYYHKQQQNLNKRESLNPVKALLYQKEAGAINDDQLNTQLQSYRNADNRDQILDELTRVGIKHQHNLSLSGGTKTHSYMASINYLGNYENQKFQNEERIGVNLKDDIKFCKWLTINLGFSGNFSNSSKDTGMGNYKDLLTSAPSYYMLRDENGNPLAWQKNKSDYELERLQSIGLVDETYIPLNNLKEENIKKENNYYRIQAGLNFKLIEGLTVDFKYQTEKSNYKDRELYTARSYKVRNMINDAAQYDKDTQELTLNVPKGGQLSETRGDTYSYTLRGQINFNRTFNKHGITAIAGAERRMVRSTNNENYYMGYDDNSLGVKPINSLVMSPISGTESLGGSYNWVYDENNKFEHIENRYVSFYANGSYTFNDRYAVTGSVRIDQSNLFGTDPKYQYRPLWSIGGSWYAAEESFLKDAEWLDRLNFRLTYGIGGNVPKDAGPYMTVENYGFNNWVGDFSNKISNPPNNELRWEKTASTNVGIDFSILGSRLYGSIDYYNKNTTDLLGTRNADPTLGWSQLLVNYGTMYNRGVEINLGSTNIRTRNFEWNTNVMFSYNKNKLTNLEGTQESVFNYNAYNVAAVGYPLNSLFSYCYAGLDHETGQALAYNANGEKVKDVTSVNELVYSGTRTPKYTASMTNRFSYAGFDLSFMFIYYGGHVMRDVISPYLTSYEGGNINRKALNYWKKPGDEDIPGVAPAMNKSTGYKLKQVWYSADIHVKKADYIKLRDITLTYNFPKNWLKECAMESAALTLQISNAWWWAANGDIDPEAYTTSGYGFGTLKLPNPATYTLGVSINF